MKVSERYVRAKFDYSATSENCLSFRQGDILLVNSKDPSGWWDGIVGGVRGWFPSNYVEPLSLDDVPTDTGSAIQQSIASNTSSVSLRSLISGSSIPKSSEQFPSQTAHKTQIFDDQIDKSDSDEKTHPLDRLSIATSAGSCNCVAPNGKSQNLKLIRAWDSAIDPILKSISIFNSAIKSADTQSSSVKCRRTTAQIRALLEKTITTWDESTEMGSRAVDLTAKLAKLLVASKVFESPWAGEDFREVLRFQAGQLLLALRTLVSTGYILEIEPLCAQSSTSMKPLLAKLVAEELLLHLSYWLKEITDVVAYIGKLLKGIRVPYYTVKDKILLVGAACGRITLWAEIVQRSYASDSNGSSLILRGLSSKLSVLTERLYQLYKAPPDHVIAFDHFTVIMDMASESVEIIKSDLKWVLNLEDSITKDDIRYSALDFSNSQSLEYRKFSDKFSQNPAPPRERNIIETMNTIGSIEMQVSLESTRLSKSVSKENPISTSSEHILLFRSTLQYVLFSTSDFICLKVFLLAFHHFGTAAQLISEIEIAAKSSLREPDSSSRIIDLLSLWLEEFWITDLDDPSLNSMEDFVSNYISSTADAAKRLTHRLKLRAYTKTFSLPSVNPKSPIRVPRPILPKGRTWTLFDLDSLELARQLTLIEVQIFNRIQSHELFKGEWLVKERTSRAVHVKNLTSFSTNVSGWVVRTILGEPDLKKRISFMKFFIKLAEKCLSIFNFNAAIAIKSAIQSASISRLKKSWAAISDKYINMFNLVCDTTDHNRNFQAYRDNLNKAKRPCLPFIGLFLTDVTFTDESQPDVLPGDEIWNLDKFAKIYKIIHSLMQYQEEFHFEPVKEIQNFLMALINTNDEYDSEAMYQRSLFIEPREDKSDKLNKTLDMLQKTGIV